MTKMSPNKALEMVQKTFPFDQFRLKTVDGETYIFNKNGNVMMNCNKVSPEYLNKIRSNMSNYFGSIYSFTNHDEGYIIRITFEKIIIGSNVSFKEAEKVFKEQKQFIKEKISMIYKEFNIEFDKLYALSHTNLDSIVYTINFNVTGEL